MTSIPLEARSKSCEPASSCPNSKYYVTPLSTVTFCTAPKGPMSFLKRTETFCSVCIYVYQSQYRPHHSLFLLSNCGLTSCNKRLLQGAKHLKWRKNWQDWRKRYVTHSNIKNVRVALSGRDVIFVRSTGVQPCWLSFFWATNQSSINNKQREPKQLHSFEV